MADSEFERLKLKGYLHWTLYLNANQSYLGSAYAWLNRPGEMQRLSQLMWFEMDELFEHVLPQYEKALERFSGPDHVNYAWLGNNFEQHGGHGHMHLVPRYETERRFVGLAFFDVRWGKNYAPRSEWQGSEEVLLKIRDGLRCELSR